jgi:hypothetical protein
MVCVYNIVTRIDIYITGTWYPQLHNQANIEWAGSTVWINAQITVESLNYKTI